MGKLILFTDGSVNVQTKIGFGAFLLVDNIKTPLDELKDKVQTVRFEATSSTKLELQTLLLAFATIRDSIEELEIYTDSQNIMSLLIRRNRLEENNFYSKGNELLNNSILYRDFFGMIDRFHCKFIKVKGHKKSSQKDDIERIFTLVDRASRNALRQEYRNRSKD